MRDFGATLGRFVDSWGRGTGSSMVAVDAPSHKVPRRLEKRTRTVVTPEEENEVTRTMAADGFAPAGRHREFPLETLWFQRPLVEPLAAPRVDVRVPVRAYRKAETIAGMEARGWCYIDAHDRLPDTDLHFTRNVVESE